ncbi:hypothetical protein SEA_CRUNCHYBOI_30 [Microbacterium phage CrunchyBoi]|nr:hypothetical protein SEA_CRUNCHYBOI_30 [Microbacterium phage CrunchyBoi]
MKSEATDLLDMIVKAIRSNKRLDVEFRDHRNQRWVLSLKRVEE